MKKQQDLTAEERAKQKRLEDFLQRFHELQAQTHGQGVSDEEFMAETEATDEQYKRGFVLPGVGGGMYEPRR